MSNAGMYSILSNKYFIRELPKAQYSNYQSNIDEIRNPKIPKLEIDSKFISDGTFIHE